MRIYPTNRYVAGTSRVTCPRCAFDYLRSQMKKEPDTNLIVCPECYDPAHPRLKPRLHLRERFIKIDIGGESNLQEDFYLLTEDGNILLTEDGFKLTWK